MVLTRAGQRKHNLTAVATAVFDTAELLEQILLALPTKDLLLAQRVSKTWRAAINNSLRTIQALFLKPIAVTDAPPRVYVEDGVLAVAAPGTPPTGLFNPLLPGCPSLPIISGAREPSRNSALTPIASIPRPGSANPTSISKMLVSLPAVTSIRVSICLRTPGERLWSHFNYPYVTNAAGVRMQDVYDRVVAAYDEWNGKTTDEIWFAVMPNGGMKGGT